MATQSSWGWVTSRGLNASQPENLVGYSFDSAPTYQQVAFRDGDNDGVAIDGFAYNVSHHFSFTAEIT